MNSWTRCFIAALGVAGIGALCLSLIAPAQREHVTQAEAMRAEATTDVVTQKSDDRRTRSASRD